MLAKVAIFVSRNEGTCREDIVAFFDYVVSVSETGTNGRSRSRVIGWTNICCVKL